MKLQTEMSYSKLGKRYLNLAWKIILWNLISFAAVIFVSPMFGNTLEILPLITLVSVLIGTSIGIVVFQHQYGHGKRAK